MIWLGFALMALVAGGLLLLGRRGGAVVDPLAHYKAQLAEIEEDESRGIIDAESARAAKLEVQRRILKVADDKATTQSVAGDWRGVAPLALAALVGAFALYGLMGSPDKPSQPGEVITGRAAPVQEGGPTFDEAIKSVEAHLEQNPDDVQGWEVLGKSARAVRDYSTAANAFAELAELQPNQPNWRVQQFENMMAMSRGEISPAARLVLAQLLEDAPDHPAGQYYLGLIRFKAGDTDGARTIWQSLADRSNPNAPWMPVVRQRLADLGVRPPALSQNQMDAVNQMAPEDRQAFIASMMERLAARLESQPDDPEGWLMLARSHLAMDDREAAIAALERGLTQVSAENRPRLSGFLDNLKGNPDL